MSNGPIYNVVCIIHLQIDVIGISATLMSNPCVKRGDKKRKEVKLMTQTKNVPKKTYEYRLYSGEPHLAQAEEALKLDNDWRVDRADENKRELFPEIERRAALYGKNEE